MPCFALQPRLRSLALALAAACGAGPVLAQAPADPATRSALDAPLFYQLLIGEIELRSGEPGTAFQVMLDAARRTRDESLFRRSVEIALQARAGDEALNAVRAWRAAAPKSAEALRYQVQLLMALKRSGEVAEPLESLLTLTPAGERPGLIASLPRFLQPATDHRAAAQMLERLLKPYAVAEATRTASQVALGRVWLAAGDSARALELAQRARADDRLAPGPALLALDLMTAAPAAEGIVTDYVAQPDAEVAVRLAYVRALTEAQRYADAVTRLRQLTGDQPALAPPWLTLGALLLELHQPAEAEQALQRFVALRGGDTATPPSAATGHEEREDDASDDGALIQAWLLLSQAAEQRGDLAGAERWLARVDSPQRALEVATRRGVLMARQGQLRQARELVRRVPERRPEDARAKLLAEAQVLREVKQWPEAYEVLGTAQSRFPDDPDLLYEQSMTAEKLGRFDEMERQLRRVIELKPDQQHAYNALGYSLADRNVRLSEAQQLVRKALELAPNDPFITDSLGWVEYRLGNRDESLRLLRRAYAARPDVEIAAHLGEVLWAAGQQDEARQVWRQGRQRDASNEVLRETLARLKVDL